ncbi:hypothetical protein N7527_005870 [Penicillium freii]|nr:hypothetical protein N7527_005870 [Penicillium freii]
MAVNWRNRAVEAGDLIQSLYQTVLDQVKERRQRGLQRDSFMDRILDTVKQTPLSENKLRFLGGVLMEEASDTSSSLILTIIQVMTKYPEVQAKHYDRMTTSMVNSFRKDRALFSMSIHHCTERWEEPEDFQPEGFASLGVWLRRIQTPRPPVMGRAGAGPAPGIHLAERNLIIVANLLWAFEFLEPASSDDISAHSGANKRFVHCRKDYGLCHSSPLSKEAGHHYAGICPDARGFRSS